MKALKSHLLFFILLNTFVFSQVTENKTTDTINVQEYTYDKLREAYSANEKDSAIASMYLQKYILKAKKENNIIKLADGYEMLFTINRINSTGLKYADSIIELTKNIDHKIYPAKGYILKSYYYYKTGDYEKAFDNRLIALEHATLQNNTEQLITIKHFLAVIKKRLGEKEEALALFKEYLSLIEANNIDGKKDHVYKIALLSVSDAYRFNKKLDTALIMVKKSIDASKGENYPRQYYSISLLSAGMILHDREEYKRAIDTLYKARDFLEVSTEKTNLALSYLYLGKSHDRLKKPVIAIDYLKKTDSILKKFPKILPDFREGYEYLIDHYKTAGDKDLQLYYVERLLHIDSILDSNYRYLSKNIVQKYDTPTLMAEKKQLIKLLYKKNRLSYSGIVVLAILLVIAFVFALYYYRKQKILKERFNALMNTHNDPEKAKPAVKREPRNEDIGVSKEVAKMILNGLSKFIEKQEYLSQKINLHSLAKKLQTNPKYLSKTINFYEQKSFTSYINDLRIGYVIDKLKIDRRLQSYAISAIASEIGFNNQQSFSQAFHKKTGIHPSYFIKQLQKHDYN